MKEFRVYYTAKAEDGEEADHCKVRVWADDKDGAKVQARCEHWDIDTIDQVTEC